MPRMAKAPAKSRAKGAAAGVSAAMRVVVIYGGEPMLIREHFDTLRAALEAEHGPIEPKVFDGKTCQLADVLDELRTLGLMSSHSLVVVDDADQFVKDERGYRSAIMRYVEKPCDSGTLVLRGTQWNRGNLDKAIAKVGTIIKCEPLKHREASSWLTARATQVHKVRLDPKAATMLVERVGCSLGLLDGELAKLAVSIGGEAGQTIGVDAVEALVGRGSDEQAWAVQEQMIATLMSGRAGPAIEKLHEVVELAGHARELVSWAAMDLCRKLHHAAVLASSGQGDAAICERLRIWPFDRRKPFMDAARRVGARRAAALLDRAVAADRRAKSGLGELHRNLEGFCVAVADIAR
jgi:DNA polymerase-3 subunit delta